jgi:hypothetical protein
MYVSVIHTTSDPETFWSKIQAAGDPPEGLKLHTVFPSGDGSKAVCLWAGPSAEAVRELVEGTVGEVSDNEYIEVDESKAQGLPG